MPEACWAPPHMLPQSGGRSTHQSSSTTRTSTKNVFLLTRFLNVSANGENFSYVEDALRKAPCSGAGARGVSGGLPSPSPRLLCRRCGREAAAAGTQGTGRHGTRAGGSAAKRDSAQGPDSSQPPPLLPAELSPPHRPGLPGSVQPGVPVGLPETPRAASLSSGRKRWSQTTCPNPRPRERVRPMGSLSSPGVFPPSPHTSGTRGTPALAPRSPATPATSCSSWGHSFCRPPVLTIDPPPRLFSDSILPAAS